MKAVQTYVNWSEVARFAFEAKLSELVSEKEVQDMEEVVERLRRFKRQIDGTDDWYTRGVEFGRRWAMNQAAPDQLERVELFRKSIR